MMPKPKLCPPREAARILGVSFATVKQWIYKGKLRTVRTLGGHHRILEEDIERHCDHELTSLITADAAAELGLRTGDNVIALLKSSQVMILRNPQ
jgi:excisionase family DNA binding protein